MAYNEFAYFYDEFNGEADYEALYAHIKKELEAHGIHDGILADLGCGTGELTLMLTQAGWHLSLPAVSSLRRIKGRCRWRKLLYRSLEGQERGNRFRHLRRVLFR